MEVTDGSPERPSVGRLYRARRLCRSRSISALEERLSATLTGSASHPFRPGRTCSFGRTKRARPLKTRSPVGRSLRPFMAHCRDSPDGRQPGKRNWIVDLMGDDVLNGLKLIIQLELIDDTISASVFFWLYYCNVFNRLFLLR